MSGNRESGWCFLGKFKQLAARSMARRDKQTAHNRTPASNITLRIHTFRLLHSGTVLTAYATKTNNTVLSPLSLQHSLSCNSESQDG